VVPDRENDVFCQVGAVLVKLCAPSWIDTLEPTRIRPTRTHALVGIHCRLGFRIDKFSPTAGGVPTPATIFPLLWEDHVNNHLSLGVPPRTRIATPVRSRSLLANQKYRALHPGQLPHVRSKIRLRTWSTPPVSGVLSSQIRSIEPSPCQLSARSSRGARLAPNQTLLGQAEDASSHMSLSAVSSRGLSSQIRRYRAFKLSRQSS